MPRLPDPPVPVDAGGLPAVRLGHGPAVVLLPGLSWTSAAPRGRALLLRWELARLAHRFRITWLGRPRGLPAGTTVGDLAAAAAGALEALADRPVPVLGYSTGGFIGLHLAADRPDLVSRLVVLGAGHRLTDAARASDLAWADALERGSPGDAARSLAEDLGLGPQGRLVAGHVLAAAGALTAPHDTSDGVATARAEAELDLAPVLPGITVPTLIVVGERDPTCSLPIARRTAALIPGSRLFVVRGAGHVGLLRRHAAVAAVQGFLQR